MTFDDDYVQLETTDGTVKVPCRDLGLEFPPPERLWADVRRMSDQPPHQKALVAVGSAPIDGGRRLDRVSHSQITDEQREQLTHVARGALYREVAGA